MIALCAPVALATPPEEPPPAAPEIAPPPVAAPEPAVPPSDPLPPPAEALPAPVEAPPPEPVPPPVAVSPPPAEVPAPPVEVSPPPAEAPPPVEAPPPAETSPPPAAAPARATTRAAQDPPPDEPVESPDETEPELPLASDPSCVFPQYEPDPDLDDEECRVLVSDCTVLGTPGPDILVGEATADLICGLGGDDQIDGGDGNDAILGGDGNDRLTGGPGGDCMFGQRGEDEFPDGGEDDGFLQDDEEQIGSPSYPDVDRHGCAAGGVLSPEPAPLPSEEAQGGSQYAVEAAGLVYELSRLIDESSQNGGGGASAPLGVPATARVEDGVVLLLLDCEQTAVTGTVELFERRGDRRVRAGRADFECAPPSKVVEVELEADARDRLEARGRLALILRIAADGYVAGESRLTVRADQ